jgi:adenylate cyclase
MERVLKKPGDITAWDAILRSDAHIRHVTLPSVEAAISEARRAIAIAPDYDAAYATLAAALAVLLHFHAFDDTRLREEVVDNVAKARALSPESPLVLCRVAGAMNFIGMQQDALSVCQRALEINSNLDVVHLTLATILINLGRFEEAIAECNIVDRLAPRGTWESGSSYFRALAHFHAGQFEQSLMLLDGLRFGNRISTQMVRMLCLVRLGRWHEAVDDMRNLRNADAQYSRAFIERFVRTQLYHGPDNARFEDNALTICRLWDAIDAPKRISALNNEV